MPLAQGMQTKLVGDFSSVHGIRKILFVCKHQQHSIAKLILSPQGNFDVNNQIDIRSARAKLLKHHTSILNDTNTLGNKFLVSVH